MRRRKENISITRDMFELVLSVMRKCTDDYLFMLDFKNDLYNISEEAIEQFNLPAAKFSNVSGYLMPIVYPDDREMLNEDLDDLLSGRKTAHNLDYRWLDKNGNIVWISCRGEVVKDEDGTPGFMIGRISQIGKKRRADNLTGFFTEARLITDYESLKKENPNISGSMLKIGIDNFKTINEKHGMEKGDEVIRIVADCIAECVKESSIYHVDGDEFIVFNCSGRKAGDMQELYDKICRTIEDANKKNGYKIFCSISGGIVSYPEDASDYSELQKKAEFAINTAKRRGKSQCFEYNDDEYKAYIKRLDIQESLRKSVENDFEGFELFYQPIMDMQKNQLSGAESLLRWSSKEYGMMSPVQFVPILEESGLIIPVGKWIIKTAIKQCRDWIKYIPHFKMNINLSYVQIKNGDLFSDIMRYLKEYELPSEHVVFELTESGNIETDNSVLSLMDLFYENDIKLAIDDFGTGYSNLRYLQYLKVNLIKIDRSFVCKAMDSSYDYTLIKNIIELAHSINLNVCLEGVETNDEKDVLNVLSPDYIQGYLYGKPMPSSEFGDKFMAK